MTNLLRSSAEVGTAVATLDTAAPRDDDVEAAAFLAELAVFLSSPYERDSSEFILRALGETCSGAGVPYGEAEP